MQLVHPCAPTAARMLARGSTRRRHRWGVGSKHQGRLAGNVRNGSVREEFARSSARRPRAGAPAGKGNGSRFGLDPVRIQLTCCSSPWFITSRGSPISKGGLRGAHTPRARGRPCAGATAAAGHPGHSVFSVIDIVDRIGTGWVKSHCYPTLFKVNCSHVMSV
jgi:hypothetical protein